MAGKLIQSPIPAPHVAPLPTTKMMMMMMISHKQIPATQTRSGRSARFWEYRPIRVAEQGSGLVGDYEERETKEDAEEEEEEEEEDPADLRTPAQLKAELYEALQGMNRGIFGVPSEKRDAIEGLIELLEAKNPVQKPTLFLDKVGGCWRLVYSTITILGSKRTKLGLRDFISLGDFLQTIDVDKGKAVNVIKFNVRGLNLFNGQLRIEASFRVASQSRVNIKYDESTITPNQLMTIFQKNYKLLLEIFNPEGWLDITYVDDTLRIGRDDKGNIFVLERCEDNKNLP